MVSSQSSFLWRRGQLHEDRESLAAIGESYCSVKVLFKGNYWEVAALIVGREDNGVFVLGGRSHLAIKRMKEWKNLIAQSRYGSRSIAKGVWC